MDKLKEIAVSETDGVVDVTFYFEGTDEPFSIREFEPGTLTHNRLQQVINAISWYQHTADAMANVNRQKERTP